jgi:hypothetical protein
MAHAVQQLSWPVPAVPGRTGTSSVQDRTGREGAWRIGVNSGGGGGVEKWGDITDRRGGV